MLSRERRQLAARMAARWGARPVLVALLIAASAALGQGQGQDGSPPSGPNTAGPNPAPRDGEKGRPAMLSGDRPSLPLLFPRGSARSNRTPSKRPERTDLAPQPGDAVLLRNQDGQKTWTVFGTEMEQFLEYLRSKNERARNEPEFSIASVSIEGSADDETALLTVRIAVEVIRSDGWVDVPLALQGGFVQKEIRQTGPGEVLGLANNRAAGSTVSLRGKGLHKLSLSLLVPVRRQLNQRRLQLTLPPAAATELVLSVPTRNCRVKQIEGAQITPSPLPQGTRITAYGLAGQFDLIWEIPVDEAQARRVFDTVTRCTLAMEGERLQFHALQSIDPKQGTLASVRVRMPSGFRLIAGSQKDVADGSGKKYTAADVDPSGFVKVDLKPVAGGRVDLVWELEAAAPPNGPIALRGFDVEGARYETGEVSLVPAEGFHFEFRGGANVRRISGVGAGLAESTYSFSQPFRLETALEEIRPQFSVEPTLFLLLSAQRAELTGQFRIQVHQGAVREIALHWPDWKKQGWTIDEDSDSPEVVAKESKGAAGDGDLRFRFSGRRGADFILTFRAARPVSPDGKSFPLVLPVFSGALRPVSTLIVADAENVKSTLEPRAQTAVRPIGLERRESVSIPEPLRGLRQVAWRIDSAIQAFDATVAVQKQEVETESTVGIDVQEGRLQVTQRISYHVSYERLAEAALILPKELRRGGVQFHLDRSDAAFETVPTWTAGEGDSGEIARIAFEPRRIGAFDIYARYFVPLAEPAPNETSSEVSVPFLRSRDAVYKAMRVELRAGEDTEADVADESWSPQIPQISQEKPVGQEKASTHAWTVAGERTAIPLRLVRAASAAAPRLKIAKALIRSTLDLTGQVRTVADYRLESPAASVVLSLPPQATDPKFSLDGVGLKPERIRETPAIGGGAGGGGAGGGGSEFRLDIGTLSPNPERVLSVEFRDAEASPCGFVALHRLQAPAFPDSTTIGSLLWEVTFPYEQYLFLGPRGFSPEFRWRRESVFFSREPTRPAADLESWLGRRVRAIGDQGNPYAFSRFGGAPTIVVGSMAQSFVIVVGAGLSLLAAFVLLKLRAARTPLTLFVFAFAIAVAYLWFAEGVRLLLQPAIFGVLLAIVAAIVDARIQTRRARYLIAAPSAADFVATATSPSSIERALVPSSDPAAPRLARTEYQVLPPPEPVSSSDRGSGA